MSESFDPYYQWLSIPPEERPPHAYRLLGLKKYEPDRDVIANAADRQMAHVKSYATGPHGQSSQLILNELAKAKRTLIDPAQKAKYDESLRKHETPRAKRVKKVAVARAIPLDELATPVDVVSTATITLPPLRRKKKEKNTALIGHIVAPIVGVLLGCLILAYLLSHRGGGEPQVSQEEKEAKRRVVQMNQPSRPKNLIPATRPTEVKQPVAPKPAPVAVAPQPAPQPEPAAPADPFEQLGDAIEIPSLAALDRVEIAKILLPVDAELTISLAAAPIADRPELKFRLGDGLRSGAEREWDLLIAKLPEEAGGEVKTAKIGGLTFTGDTLSFCWTDVARQLPSGQLRNGVLQLDVDGNHRDVPLRNAVHVPPLSLELVNSVDRIQMTVTDRPDTAAVYFQLLDNSVIRSDHEFDPADARVQLGQRLTIKLPQTEVRLRPYTRDDELTIETIGRYKIAGKEFPLTVDRVNKQLQTFQRQLVADQNELRTCQRRALEYSMRLSGMARLPADARKVLESDMIRLQNLAAKNTRRIEALVENLSFLQAAIQQLPLIVNLGNALQSSSKLHYRVFVMLENHEVDLLVSDDAVESLPGEGDELNAASDEELKEVQDALARLAADPNDAAANRIVGRHYCLQQNNWSKGLRHLAQGDDEKLATAATIDLENASEPEELVAIGDAWYDLAAGSKPHEAYLVRAKYWYQLAKPDVAGLLGVKVNERLKEIDAKAAAN